MNDHAFVVCLLLLSIIGLIFSRYLWSHSDGVRHRAMFLLEVSFILVILYAIGVMLLDFPIIRAREILLVFMGLVVLVLGVIAVDDWIDRIDKARMEAEAQEIIKMRHEHNERRTSNRLV